MKDKIYVVLEDVDEAYNSIVAFSDCEQAEKYVLKHSTPQTRLIIDEVKMIKKGC